MSGVPTDALNDWGHNDLDGFANYIGSPIEHIRKLSKKNEIVIRKENGEEVVDEEKSD